MSPNIAGSRDTGLTQLLSPGIISRRLTPHALTPPPSSSRPTAGRRRERAAQIQWGPSLVWLIPQRTVAAVRVSVWLIPNLLVSLLPIFVRGLVYMTRF